MKEYLGNLWIKIGLTLVVLGWGPLLAIILLAAIGLWPDPDPNPIGPGLLFFFTAWPAIICLGIGVFKVQGNRFQGQASVSIGVLDEQVTADWRTWVEHPVVRVIAGLAGLGLTLYGATAVLDGKGRGGAAAVVIGIVAVYWALVGRIPSWFRR